MLNASKDTALYVEITKIMGWGQEDKQHSRKMLESLNFPALDFTPQFYCT